MSLWIANKAYFESAAIAYGVWVRTRHFVLDWPEHGNDLKNFAKSLPNLLAFKDALLGVVPYIKMETTWGIEKIFIVFNSYIDIKRRFYFVLN